MSEMDVWIWIGSLALGALGAIFLDKGNRLETGVAGWINYTASCSFSLAGLSSLFFQDLLCWPASVGIFFGTITAIFVCTHKL